jgi:sugar-specific transcriptional regulator TrmB
LSISINDLFARLGLKEREGRVYLACLRAKEGAFVFEVASQTHLPRSTVDLTVRRLLRRGFLNKSKSGRRLRFVAVDPDAILFRQKQLVEDMESMLPVLKRLGGERKEMEIHFFEGALGFRQGHAEILRAIKMASPETKDVLSFSSGSDSMHLFPDMQRAFIDKRIKNGSWYRAIAPKWSASVPEWKSDNEALREVRHLPDEASLFRMDIQIYADSVMLYSTTPPIGGVTLRNEKVAASMRTLFNLLWKSLPETK